MRDEMRESLSRMAETPQGANLAVVPSTIFFALHKKAAALQMQNAEKERLNELKQQVNLFP